MGLEPHLFKDGELELFNLVSAHLSKFGKLPSQETIISTPGFDDSLAASAEPPKFYLEEVEKRYVHGQLKGAVNEIASLLTEKHVDEALDALVKVAMGMYQKKFRRHVTDFRDAAQIVYKSYVAQKSSPASVTTHFGWETLDAMSGGARAGDFISIIGRPMMGKTFMMLYTSRHAWRKQGKKPLLVSMEMLSELLHTRLAAMDTQTQLTNLMKAELSTKAFNSMMGKLSELNQMPQPYWVVDGSVVRTVEDLIMQCQILQPDCLWIDAAYLLKHQNTKMNKYEKQGDNAEQIKERIATAMEMPVMCSYQFSKESSKSKKKNKDAKPTLDDIYGSDVIAQISSVSLGLLESEDNIEAAKKRNVSILKGRSGEIGEFPINWDFSSKMDFSEYKKEDTEEMQLGHLG